MARRVDEAAEQFRRDAVGAIEVLGMLRGALVFHPHTPEKRVARMALLVALSALNDLAHPSHEGARVVERMYRALLGADERGDRLAVYELYDIVVQQRWGILRGVRRALVEFSKDHCARAPVPDDAELAELFTRLKAGKLKVSGVIARILIAMRIGTFAGVQVRVVTQRVCAALAAQEKAVPPRKGGVAANDGDGAAPRSRSATTPSTRPRAPRLRRGA